MQLVGSRLDHAPAGLGDLVPGVAQVAERLGHHQTGVLPELGEEGGHRVQRPQPGEVRAEEQRPGPALAGVAERVGALPVRGGHGHLDRVLDAVLAPDLLDDPDRALHRGRRVLLQPQGEGEVEEDLRVRGPLDLGVQVGVDLEHQVTLDVREVADEAVVHPQPSPVPERVAVGLLHGATRGGPDVREDQWGGDVAGELAQVPVVPGRCHAVVHRRDAAGAVPGDAEPVPVRGLGTELGVQALVDEGVRRCVQQPLEQHGTPGVGEPAAHADSSGRAQWWKPLGCAWCGTGASRLSSQPTASRRSRRNSSAMSWLKPLRTTTRRTARSSRLGGIVYAGTSQPRSRSLRDTSYTSYLLTSGLRVKVTTGSSRPSATTVNSGISASVREMCTATSWQVCWTRRNPSLPSRRNWKYCSTTWAPGREKFRAKVGMSPPR